MNERGLHTVGVKIESKGVSIESTFRPFNDTRPVKSEVGTFNSIDTAKRNLNSLSRLYQRFLNGYRAFEVAEALITIGLLTQDFADFIINNNELGKDLLRTAGIIAIFLLTIKGEFSAEDNLTKTRNQLSTLQKAEERGLRTHQEVYPYY